MWDKFTPAQWFLLAVVLVVAVIATAIHFIDPEL